ncbi:MAG TPA: hypothetical protein VF951_01970, partial [Streptosporangiaceae bacterium]
YRRISPAVVLTHPLADPYNPDHPAAARMTLQARVLAQAAGHDAPGEPFGAPPVFLFEPHQPEQCDFKPQVLLDITDVFAIKRRAMEALVAQQHMWDYWRGRRPRTRPGQRFVTANSASIATSCGRGLPISASSTSTIGPTGKRHEHAAPGPAGGKRPAHLISPRR